MSVWNLGSINADHVYHVPHIPAPGETLAASDLTTGLGGKGANISVAVARAGGAVHHIGAVGPDGADMLDRITRLGVATDLIARVAQPTGHAIIALAQDAENAITLYPGANRAIPADHVTQALGQAQPGDWLVMQNETNLQPQAAAQARAKGLRIAYVAAPFDADAVRAVLADLDLLILNAVEWVQLTEALGPISRQDLRVIVTKGADGADLHQSDQVTHIPAVPAKPVDTTGAGDTFAGYVIAGLDGGQDILTAMRLAAQAAALMVTRHGTAEVIPAISELPET